MTDVKFSIDYLGPSSVRFNFKFSSGTTLCFWDDIEHHDRSCDIDDMEMIKYLDDFMYGKTSKFEFRVGMDTSTLCLSKTHIMIIG
jgi:hypothetical protein